MFFFIFFFPKDNNNDTASVVAFFCLLFFVRGKVCLNNIIIHRAFCRYENTTE